MMDPVPRFRRRHLRSSAWIRARFEVRHPQGLPLTVLVAVAVGSLWLLAGLTRAVLGHDGIAAFDPRASSWIIGHRVGGLSAILRGATFLGSNWVLFWVLGAGCVIFGLRRRSWWPVIDIVIVHGSAMILYSMIKHAVHRTRPAAAHWLSPAGGWSFPSGHATQAAAAWGILAVLAWVGRPVRTKIAIGAGAAVIILLVAFSRYYLGVHWLSDVLAGMTLGIAVLSLWGVARTTVVGTRRTGVVPPDRMSRSVDQDPSPPRTDGVR